MARGCPRAPSSSQKMILSRFSGGTSSWRAGCAVSIFMTPAAASKTPSPLSATKCGDTTCPTTLMTIQVALLFHTRTHTETTLIPTCPSFPILILALLLCRVRASARNLSRFRSLMLACLLTRSLLHHYARTHAHTEESESGSGYSSEGCLSDHGALDSTQAFRQPETHSGHGHAPTFLTDESGACVSV